MEKQQSVGQTSMQTKDGKTKYRRTTDVSSYSGELLIHSYSQRVEEIGGCDVGSPYAPKLTKLFKVDPANQSRVERPGERGGCCRLITLHPGEDECTGVADSHHLTFKK